MKFLAFVLNLPWNIVGLLLALCSLPHRVAFNKEPFAVIIHVRSFWWQAWLSSHKGVRASSIGNIILLSDRIASKDLEHELIHVRQYEQRPFIQALLYIFETTRHGYKNNKYEIEAYEKAGNTYVESNPLIKSVKTYPAKIPAQKHALVLCGFGGSIWQTKRLLRVLHKAGYDVTAMDFPEAVLSKGDPQLLLNLMDEVTTLAEAETKKVGKPILLVGISLGALVSLNIMRRSELFSKGVLVTGGDIVKVAQNIYGHKVWPQSYDELAKIWKSLNMYSRPSQLKNKRILFVLPSKDRLIDPTDVRQEVKVQNDAGNVLMLVERHAAGHIGTIIEETILFPKRILDHIERVENE